MGVGLASSRDVAHVQQENRELLTSANPSPAERRREPCIRGTFDLLDVEHTAKLVDPDPEIEALEDVVERRVLREPLDHVDDQPLR